jgi:GNAT superfamily N-acetyltransferase
VIRVEHLARTNRAALCAMLQDENDFPQHLLYLYQRPSSPDENLLAWRDERIDGMLTGTFRHDFSNREFGDFELPRSPHALLTRMHVRRTQRRHGIGEVLVAQFAAEANEHGCSFIGGYLDGSSDKTGRRAFFERLGFTVSGFDSFGARPAEILASAGIPFRPIP